MSKRVFWYTHPDDIQNNDLLDIPIDSTITTCFIIIKYKNYWTDNEQLKFYWSLVLDNSGIEECANWSIKQQRWIHKPI